MLSDHQGIFFKIKRFLYSFLVFSRRFCCFLGCSSVFGALSRVSFALRFLEALFGCLV